MAFPTRKLEAICEISTATLIIQNQPKAFEGEADAMTVDVKFKNDGQDCDISIYLAEMYLFYPSADEMTDAVDMTISGSSASAAFPEILTAKGGSPLLVIRIKDQYNGNILTACAAPIRIQNVLGKTVITTRPPTPSEVVYIGRAPYISEESGNWMTWDAASSAYVDTGKSATGPQGEQGIQGVQGIQGIPGSTPYIGENGNWFVGNEDTLIAARGPKGEQGDAAPIPYIGENGNWFVGDTDTGTKAQGPAGQNGTGSGTVTGVKVGNQTYAPAGDGVVELPAPDTTLKEAGKAADAGAVGTALSELENDIGNKLPSDGTAVNTEKLKDKTSDFYKSYTNLSINSDFTRWIAQAGIGGMHGTQAYGGDCWILTEGSITGSANADGDGYSNITLNGTLVQVVPSPPAVATLFVEMVSGTTTRQEYDASKGEIIISSAGGVIKNVLLLEGEWSEKPEYVSKGYAAEFATCQLYFIGKIGFMGLGFAQNDTSVRIPVNLYVPMRVAPSLSSAVLGWVMWDNDGYFQGSASVPMEKYSSRETLIEVSANIGSASMSSIGTQRPVMASISRLFISADLPRR